MGMNIKTIKNLFIVAGLYDLILSLTVLFAFKQLYSYFQIALPNHVGYIQFAAALVAIFGIGFLFVAQDPAHNLNIIIMGILLKFSYSSIVLYYAAIKNIPSVWIPFAWLDLIFLILFIVAFRSLKSQG